MKRSGGDQAGPLNETITIISEMGNSQGESKTDTVNVQSNTVFPGDGELLVNRTFSGNQLPTEIRVRVIEDDGAANLDDGVCNVKIKTAFTTEPINVECRRENNDGLGDINIVNIRIQVL